MDSSPQQPAALHATDSDMRSQQSLSYSRNFPRLMAPTTTLPLSQQQHIGSLPNPRTRIQPTVAHPIPLRRNTSEVFRTVSSIQVSLQELRIF